VGNYIRVERRADGFDSFTTLANISPNSTSYVDASGLQSQGTYYYRIKVFSGSDSAWSNEASVTMAPFDIPAPTALKAVVDSASGKKYLHMSWKSTSNQFEVTDVERSVTTQSNYMVIGQFIGYMTSHTYTYDDTTAVRAWFIITACAAGTKHIPLALLILIRFQRRFHLHE